MENLKWSLTEVMNEVVDEVTEEGGGEAGGRGRGNPDKTRKPVPSTPERDLPGVGGWYGDVHTGTAVAAPEPHWTCKFTSSWSNPDAEPIITGPDNNPWTSNLKRSWLAANPDSGVDTADNPPKRVCEAPEWDFMPSWTDFRTTEVEDVGYEADTLVTTGPAPKSPSAESHDSYVSPSPSSPRFQRPTPR